MKKRECTILGSARVSRAGDGVLASTNFPWRVEHKSACPFVIAAVEKFVAVGHRNQHAGRVRYPGRGGQPAGKFVSRRSAR